jgi:hypothetical protein
VASRYRDPQLQRKVLAELDSIYLCRKLYYALDTLYQQLHSGLDYAGFKRPAYLISRYNDLETDINTAWLDIMTSQKEATLADQLLTRLTAELDADLQTFLLQAGQLPQSYLNWIYLTHKALLEALTALAQLLIGISRGTEVETGTDTLDTGLLN